MMATCPPMVVTQEFEWCWVDYFQGVQGKPDLGTVLPG
jgi:hypothetical protein